ncbi:uncharacterized protein CDV56_107212 [Aspergillus thermomutatus]|uniref:NAD(P)-binding domain-containing protein n=1 Tax=Aspergillus thermomutatus TaxID=41047 RepID=A0A397HX02_ASPTH|nr:uncharacterized protein CDV56_107212 [Aspergillus thermomutatus]RHZ67327.1 hypothetical protein CDV56_107212 [Aspergillus thermomutatus]
MKIILTGATGFVGSEVLEQCLQKSVVVLARRELPPAMMGHPKLTVRIITKFMSYPDDLLRDLRGAEACIWTLAKAPDMGRTMDGDTVRVCLDYTLAAIKAFDQSRQGGRQDD